MNTLIQTDRFSAARFKAVLANNITGSRKVSVIALGIAYSIFLLTLLASTINSWKTGLSFAVTAANLSSLFPATMFMSASIMASLIMHDCARKEGKINAIMLPALNTEKFLSRIVTALFYGIAVSLALHIILFYLFVGLHYLFQGYEAAPQDLQPFGAMSRFIVINGHEMNTHKLAGMIECLIFTTWVFSCYMLGGFIWKRRSWIITSFLLVVLAIIVTFISENTSIIHSIKRAVEHDWRIAFDAAFLLLTVLNTWISYILFRRMQIVNGVSVNLKLPFRIK